ITMDVVDAAFCANTSKLVLSHHVRWRLSRHQNQREGHEVGARPVISAEIPQMAVCSDHEGVEVGSGHHFKYLSLPAFVLRSREWSSGERNWTDRSHGDGSLRADVAEIGWLTGYAHRRLQRMGSPSNNAGIACAAMRSRDLRVVTPWRKTSLVMLC